MTRLIVQTSVWIAVMAVLLFVPAGTLAWTGAWAFLAEIYVLGLAVGLWLLHYDPALLKERMSPFVQRGQTPADKIFIVVLLVLYILWMVFMGLDAARFRWSSVPVALQVLGAFFVFVSVYLSYLTFKANRFAVPVIKIQTERAHSVATTGPYRYIRHPMYAGAIFHFIGLPLLLGSWWGLLFVPPFVAALAFRIGIEEKTLKAALPGYDAYAARVRYRLIPHIW